MSQILQFAIFNININININIKMLFIISLSFIILRKISMSITLSLLAICSILFYIHKSNHCNLLKSLTVILQISIPSYFQLYILIFNCKLRTFSAKSHYFRPFYSNSYFFSHYLHLLVYPSNCNLSLLQLVHFVCRYFVFYKYIGL